MDTPDLTAFVHAWARAVTGTSYVSLGDGEVEERLGLLARRLADALLAEPFAAAPAVDVGAALVEAHFTGTATLSRTIALLPRLPAHLASDSQDVGGLADRVAELQGALAGGYARALQERTLDEQEAIRRAARTAREQAELALRASEARFSAVFAGAGIAIAVGDLDGRIVQANQALLDMLGYTLPQLHHRPMGELLHAEDAEGVWDLYRELLRGERDHARTERRLIRRDHGLLWAQLALSLVRDHHGEPSYLVAMGQDVTDRHRLQARLRYEALHDPLTRLPNRALFTQRLDHVLTHAAPGARVGLCLLDLDGFKVVNDRLGHDVGDQLLVAVSDRLDRRAESAGHLLARVGDDDFAILLEDTTDAGEAVAVAEGVLAALAEPFGIDGHALAVSAAVGVVDQPAAATHPTELLRAADTALSWAKAKGGNRYARYDPRRDAREIARYTLATTPD
jgi:diguanylate cyclase (GGDEF)-like protein/PAS domain S-box-containing protein